jgi:hypothetical protein
VNSVDIVQDVGAANTGLLEQLCSHMKYIAYGGFCDRLAPGIWPEGTASSHSSHENASTEVMRMSLYDRLCLEVTDNKRRFIAWHDRSVNYDAICRLMFAVSLGFEALKDLCQGPCPENQSIHLIS